jgi:hypothetical protein
MYNVYMNFGDISEIITIVRWQFGKTKFRSLIRIVANIWKKEWSLRSIKNSKITWKLQNGFDRVCTWGIVTKCNSPHVPLHRFLILESLLSNMFNIKTIDLLKHEVIPLYHHACTSMQSITIGWPTWYLHNWYWIVLKWKLDKSVLER